MSKGVDYLLRFLALLLVFVLGFLACAGTIVLAGVYVYGNVSYDQLRKWGINLPGTEDYIDSDPDVSLSSMTLAGLVSEIMALQRLGGDNVTLDFLVARYGLKVPEDLADILPASLRGAPFSTLFSAEGMNYLMDETKVADLLKLAPDLLSEPAKEVLEGKSLSEVMEGNFEELLADMHLGYLLGVNYEKTNGVWQVVYADPANPTAVEALESLSVGKLAGALMNDGDVLGVVRDEVGDVKLTTLLGDTDGTVADMMKDKTIADVITMDSETGTYTISVNEVLDGTYVGTLMGYYYTENAAEDGSVTLSWFKDEAKTIPLTGTDKIMAGIDIARLMDSEDDYDITDAFGDTFVGELMGYAVEYAPEDTAKEHPIFKKNGKEATGMDKTMAEIVLSDLLDGNSDMSTIFEGKTVGDLMDYTRDENGVWTDKNGNEVKGIDKAVADIDISRMMDDETYKISDAFGDMCVGELMGYTLVDGVWLDKNHKALSGVDKAVAGIELRKLMDDETSYDITTAFNGMYVGELMGYKQNTDGAWCEEVEENGQTTLRPLTGANKAMAGILLTELMDDENPYDITDAFDGMCVGELMGYTLTRGVWCDKNGKELSGVDKAVASIPVKDMMGGDYEISSAFNDTYLGEVMGYTPEKHYKEDGTLDYITWWDNYADEEHKGTEVTGVQKELAGYILAKIMNGEEEISVDNFTLADVMGLEKKVLPAVKKNADGTYTVMTDAEGKTIFITVWYDADGTRASSVLAALAEVEVGELSNKMNEILLGDVFGYTVVDGKQYQTELVNAVSIGEDVSDAVCLTPASGMLLKLADLMLKDMDDSATVEARIRTITIAEAMGYTKENGVWKDGENKEVTGILASLAETPIRDLSAKIDTIKIGEVIGWTQKDDGWYDSEGKAATGLMIHFADLTVADMKENDKVQQAVKGIKVGEAMGYVQKDGKWYATDDAEKPVSGVLATVIDCKVGELNQKLEGLTVGEVIGWELKEVTKDEVTVKVWHDSKGEEATGLMVSLADLKVDELSNNGKVTAAVKNVTVGDAMGYIKVGDTWYKTYDEETGNGEAVTGVLKSIIGCRIGEIDDKLNNMTVGESMGYTYDESDKKWYEDSAKTKKVTGVLAAIIDTKITLLNDRMNHLYVGEVIGWTQKDDGWYEGDNKATGIMTSLAGLKVNELSDSQLVSQKVQTIKVGDAMGYTYDKDEDVWYEDSTKSTKVTGVFAAIADSPISGIQSKIDETELGVILGYTKNSEGKWQDENGENVSPLLNKISGTTMKNVGTTMDTLVLGDIFTNEELTSTTGFLPLLRWIVCDGKDTNTSEYPKAEWKEITRYDSVENEDKTVKVWYVGAADIPISKLGDAVDDTMELVTMGELIEHKVIDLSNDRIATLNNVFGDESWKSLTIVSFINTMIDKIEEYYESYLKYKELVPSTTTP